MFWVFIFFLMTTVISAQYGEVPEQLDSEVKSATLPPVDETEKVNLTDTQKAPEVINSCQVAQQNTQQKAATEKDIIQEQKQQTDDRKYGLFRFSRNSAHGSRLPVTKRAELDENIASDILEESGEEVKNIEKRQIDRYSQNQFFKPISNEIAKRKPPVKNFGDHPNKHPHRHPLKYPDFIPRF